MSVLYNVVCADSLRKIGGQGSIQHEVSFAWTRIAWSHLGGSHLNEDLCRTGHPERNNGDGSSKSSCGLMIEYTDFWSLPLEARKLPLFWLLGNAP